MWLANKLTKTLQVTLKTMDMIKMGRRDIRLNTKTKSDELNHISQAFNELVNVLQTANHELENKAQFDGLTQLYNRHTFELMARDLMAQYPLESTPKQQAYLVFMFLDIDDFKHFNNDFGHEFGDRVIRFIGETIRQTIDGVGFACRQGGDEFVLCVSDPSTIEHIDEFLKRLTEGLEKGLHVRKNESIQVCCSIGVIMFPQHGIIFEELIQNADAEMYQIKQQGKGAVGIFGEHK